MKINGQLRKVKRKEVTPLPVERGKRGTIQHQILRRLGERYIWVMDTDSPTC